VKVHIFEIVLDWNNKKNGTNLMTVGILLVILNTVISGFFSLDQNTWETFHLLGFSVTILGALGKSVYAFSNTEIRLLKYFFALFGFLCLIFFVKYLVEFFILFSTLYFSK